MSNIYEIVAAISRPVDNMIFHQLYFQCIILKTIWRIVKPHKGKPKLHFIYYFKISFFNYQLCPGFVFRSQFSFN